MMTASRGAEILYTDQFIPMFFTCKFGRTSKQDTLKLKEEVRLHVDKTKIRCHVTFQWKCSACYFKIRCCTCASGGFSFNRGACVKLVFGLERLLSCIDPMSSFCPLLSLTHMSVYRGSRVSYGLKLNSKKNTYFLSDFDVSALQIYSNWYQIYG